MDWLMQPGATLSALFITSFLAATVLPGGSEVLLVAVLLAQPQQTALALGLATLGNTLGGMSTYAMARVLAQKVGAGETASTLRTVNISNILRCHGSPALLLAWAPVLGDALCAAAGWLRLPWLPCLLWMVLGKGARYAFIAWAVV